MEDCQNSETIYISKENKMKQSDGFKTNDFSLKKGGFENRLQLFEGCVTFGYYLKIIKLLGFEIVMVPDITKSYYCVYHVVICEKI